MVKWLDCSWKQIYIYIKLAFKGFFLFFLLCFFGYYQVDLKAIWYFINIKYYLKTKMVGK
jgi:hypothetical protein